VRRLTSAEVRDVVRRQHVARLERIHAAPARLPAQRLSGAEDRPDKQKPPEFAASEGFTDRPTRLIWRNGGCSHHGTPAG
jgi:hypothetical protein